MQTLNNEPLEGYPYISKIISLCMQIKRLNRVLLEPSLSNSAYVVLITKKNETTCFCVDYPKLSSVSGGDAYRLPRNGRTVDALTGSKLLSTTDSVSDYWQMQGDLNDIGENCSRYKSRSLLVRRFIGYSLSWAPSIFQRTMGAFLSGLQ